MDVRRLETSGWTGGINVFLTMWCFLGDSKICDVLFLQNYYLSLSRLRDRRTTSQVQPISLLLTLYWTSFLVESRLIKCVMSSFSLSLSFSLRTRSLCVWSLTRPKSTRCWRRWPTSSRASTASFSARKTFPVRRQRNREVWLWPGDDQAAADVSSHTRCSAGSVSSRSAATHRNGSRLDLCWPQWIQHGACLQTKTGPTVMILEDLLMDQQLFLFCLLKCLRGTLSVSLIPLVIVNKL